MITNFLPLDDAPLLAQNPRQMNTPPTVSLVVPVWNDAHALRNVLNIAIKIPGIVETIIADASPNDDCKYVAEEFGCSQAFTPSPGTPGEGGGEGLNTSDAIATSRFPTKDPLPEYREREPKLSTGRVMYIRCEKPNRGGQMNGGGRIATGDVLLFHHADTELNEQHIESIQRAATDAKFRSGSFYRRFDPAQRRRAWLVPIVRFYNRHFGALYGDQSLFITREHFISTGGFKDFPLLEDVEYSRRLRKHGGIKLVDPPIAANGRRLVERGAWRVTIQNCVIMVLYSCGASPAWLHRWYYKKKKPKQPLTPAPSSA